MSKVFKMNEWDWVYAESEEQAKEFYQRDSGEDIEEINESFEGEVSLEKTMFYEVNSLPIDEQMVEQEMRWFGGKLCAYKTFEWVIKQDNLKAPCIIASTEA